MSEDSSLGDVFHSLLGYADQPTVLQFIVWAGYLAVATTAFIVLGRRKRCAPAATAPPVPARHRLATWWLPRRPRPHPCVAPSASGLIPPAPPEPLPSTRVPEGRAPPDGQDPHAYEGTRRPVDGRQDRGHHRGTPASAGPPPWPWPWAGAGVVITA